MASTSAGPPGPNSNYTTLQRALRALRTDLESAVEQARSTGFAIVPGWDLDRIKQVGLYPDLKDEYWRLQDWAHAEAEDGTREYVKRLIEKSKQPHVSKEHTNRRPASKPAQHQAPKIRSEPERPLPGSNSAALGPAIFRRTKETQAQQQAEQQTQRQDTSSKPIQHQAPKIRSEPERPLPGSNSAALGPAIFRRLKEAQQQAEQQTQRQTSSSKPEVPKKPVPSVATPPAPAKPADEPAAQMGQLYIKSQPGTFARLLPPITGNKATIATLTVDGWTRWASSANIAWTMAAVGSDGKPILNKDGTPAVAHKLDPRAYGGTKKEYDLGYCRGVFQGCEVPDWQLCPYRHWAPEPLEHRWMNPEWLVKNDKKLKRVPFPPDHPSVKYHGCDRRGMNGGVFRAKPSVLKEAEAPKISAWHDQEAINKQKPPVPTAEQLKAATLQAPELRVTSVLPTGRMKEIIPAIPKTRRLSDIRPSMDWSEDSP